MSTKNNKDVLCFKNQRGQQHLYQQQQQGGDGGKPPALLIRMIMGVKCRYSYLKTVHSNQELDDLRFEHHCCFPNKRRCVKFKILQLRCTKANPAPDNCPFALLAWWPGPDRKQTHVYAHGMHSHRLVPADERIVQKHAVCWSDEQPPANFRTPNGRVWTYLETTTTKRGKSINLLLRDWKCRYHCFYRNMKSIVGGRAFCRATLCCTAHDLRRSTDCKFQLLAQRTDRARYHLYASGQHTCKHKNGKVTMKSSAKRNRREEKLEEEDEADEDDQEDNEHDDEMEELKDEEEEEEKDVEDVEEEDAGDQLEGEEKIPHKRKNPTTAVCWSDEEPPVANFRTPNGRQWTYLESTTTTTKSGKNINLLLRDLKRRYHCYYRSIVGRRAVCRATLCCTTHDPRRSSADCKFQLLVQRTDRGRYHLYASGQHTCKHKEEKEPLANGNWQEDGEPEEEEQDEQDEMEENSTRLEEVNDEEMEEEEEDVEDIEEDGHEIGGQEEDDDEEEEDDDDDVDQLEGEEKVPQHRQDGANAPPPPPVMLNRMQGGVKCRYSYMKTVYSLQELNALRYEHQCYQLNARTAEHFKIAQMRCHRSNAARGGCPFALLAWRPPAAGSDKKKNQQQQQIVHVYCSQNIHNHHIASADKRIAQQSAVCWSDEERPPRSFCTPTNDREWTFMETTKKAIRKNDTFVSMLDHLKRKYHCYHPTQKRIIEQRRVYRTTMYCPAVASRRTKCPFALMAQRTDRGRYHLYASGPHICRKHKDGKVTRKLLAQGKWRDEEKPEDEEEEQQQDDDDENEQEEMEEDEEEEDEIGQVEDEEMEEDDGEDTEENAVKQNLLNNSDPIEGEIEEIAATDDGEKQPVVPDMYYIDQAGNQWEFLTSAGSAGFFERHYPLLGLHKSCESSRWALFVCAERFHQQHHCPFLMLLLKHTGLLYQRREHTHPVEMTPEQLIKGKTPSPRKEGEDGRMAEVMEVTGWKLVAKDLHSEADMDKLLAQKLVRRTRKNLSLSSSLVRFYKCGRCRFRLRWLKRRGEVWELGAHSGHRTGKAIKRRLKMLEHRSHQQQQEEEEEVENIVEDHPAEE